MSRCGYIAVVGRPNVGKSTLMNHSIGVRLSITCHKPQTTRHRVLGVKTTANTQFIYLDTPGFHLGEKKAINRMMNKTALSVLNDADVVVFVTQAGKFTDEDRALLVRMAACRQPVIAALNKIDIFADKSQLLAHIQTLAAAYDFAQIVPLSAKTGQGVAALEQEVAALLPAGDFVFSEDDFTDKNMRFLAAERIREQLFYVLQAELPYAVSVEIEQFKTEPDGRYFIGAVIWVERQSQKGIVIGKGGQVLKNVGTRARKSLNHLLGNNVHLEMWVRVKQGWADSDKALISLGYQDP